MDTILFFRGPVKSVSWIVVIQVLLAQSLKKKNLFNLPKFIVGLIHNGTIQKALCISYNAVANEMSLLFSFCFFDQSLKCQHINITDVT